MEIYFTEFVNMTSLFYEHCIAEWKIFIGFVIAFHIFGYITLKKFGRIVCCDKDGQIIYPYEDNLNSDSPYKDNKKFVKRLILDITEVTRHIFLFIVCLGLTILSFIGMFSFSVDVFDYFYYKLKLLDKPHSLRYYSRHINFCTDAVFNRKLFFERIGVKEEHIDNYIQAIRDFRIYGKSFVEGYIVKKYVYNMYPEIEENETLPQNLETPPEEEEEEEEEENPINEKEEESSQEKIEPENNEEEEN